MLVYSRQRYKTVTYQFGAFLQILFLTALEALLLCGSTVTTTYGLDIVHLDKCHNVVTATNCSEPEMYLIFEDAIIVSCKRFFMHCIMYRQLP